MNLSRKAYFNAAILCTFMLLSCSEDRRAAPNFDGERAFEYLVRQVEFGPRVPGSQASAECRTYFYDFFRQLDLPVDSQAFVYFDGYSGKNIPMVNVVVSCPSDAQTSERAVVLMAHYDCRPRAEHAGDPALRDRPIDGASDGASGVAVLMELANMFKTQPPPGRVDIVLVDGEDWGREGDHNAYMIGSREFARAGIRDKYDFGIVVDLVGDKQQQLYREGYSERYAGKLNDIVWETAARLGVITFIDSVKYTVIDDHLSLNAAGVAAIDIIDFDYPYWHTESDTPDKCSAQSLANVGNVIAEVVYNLSLWPKN